MLPLTGSGKRIAVIGPGAGPTDAQQFYNGAGSGHIPEFGAKSDVVTPLQGITQRALADGDVVTYADGSVPAAAALAAKTADVAIVFAGSEDSEGVDRSTLDLSSGNCTLAGCVPQPVDQDSLISQVAAANPHTIVVLNTGGPVLMPWLNQIEGLFEAWYSGQQDGNAIAALLFGDVDPSAKLPETFPASQSDLPTRTPQQYPGVNDASGIPHATYSEGMLVGYRWYDAKHITPLFPFGFGLSYTTFALRNLHLVAGRGRPALARATFTVANTGPRLGAEVAQLYVADPHNAGEPPKQLKGFQKVLLRPSAHTTVKLPLDFRSLAHWSDAAHRWKVSSGCYRVLVGDSSRDLPLSATIAVGGARCKGAKVHVTKATLRRAARGEST
ncbi:MAG: glycoside hydrolase family 3 C-terminal domain-containing protein [Solirubrobacteraceae bacterium]